MRSRILVGVFIIIGAVALLAVVFAASGGIYRTVNVGRGTVCIINRFTGKPMVLEGGVLRRVRTHADVRRERAGKALAEQAREKSRREEKVHRIQGRVRAAEASWVADKVTKLYHNPYPRDPERPLGWPLDCRSWQTPSACVAWQPFPYDECLVQIQNPVYLTSHLQALSKGFWPCQECVRADLSPGVVRSAPARQWPRHDAPTAFNVSRGDRVRVIAEHGDFWAIPSERVATGERGACWVVKTAIETSGLRYFRQWVRDWKTAHGLQAKGLKPAEIAKRKGWSPGYVERLLRNPGMGWYAKEAFGIAAE
jgi:hypothetical protein